MATNFFKNLGNKFDSVGTRYNLPELGLSEFLTGGSTQNTGRKNIAYQPAIDLYSNYRSSSMAADPGQAFDANYLQQNWQSLGYRSLEEAMIDNGFEPPRPVELPTNTPSNTRPTGAGPSYNQPVERAARPGEAAYQPNIQFFNGVQYDVNDPAQRQAFAQARSQFADKLYAQQTGEYDYQLKQALADAADQYGSAYGGIEQDLSNLETNVKDYKKSNARQVQGLNENYDLGTVKRQNYFSSLSPLAFQSSQGSSEQFANNKRQEGLGDLKTAYDRSLTQFGQQEADLTSERARLQSGYDRFLDESRRGTEQFRTSLRNQLNAQRDDLASNFSGLDTAQQVGRFNYGRQAFDPFQGENVDLGKYTQFTDFSAVQNSPQANYFKTFKPTYAQQGDPLQQYLGYAPDKKEQDPLKNYLSRGY